jgi:replication fork clamp-binding protein CrfC
MLAVTSQQHLVRPRLQVVTLLQQFHLQLLVTLAKLEQLYTRLRQVLETLLQTVFRQ